MIPQDSPPCYHSSTRHLLVLFIHLLATLVRLLGPGGVRSIVAESLLLKHQLLIVARSRQRSPNLHASDRILAGWMALLVRPTRLLRSAFVLTPSTLLRLQKAMSKAWTKPPTRFFRRRFPVQRCDCSRIIDRGSRRFGRGSRQKRTFRRVASPFRKNVWERRIKRICQGAR
jgi:hypothetical protein